MSKDPAFLFYSQDFLVGTMAMSYEDKGKYITILCYMHQKGHLSEETIRLLVGLCSVSLMSKFERDSDGNFYSKRMEIEVEKRKKFTESRVNNGKLGGRPPKNQQVKRKKPKENLSVISSLTYAKANEKLIENENISFIVEYLNRKVGSNFKVSSTKTITLINNLFKQKYTREDFQKVIDVKCSQWLKDPAMCIYLRPETLFGNHFESYLNEKVVETAVKPGFPDKWNSDYFQRLPTDNQKERYIEHLKGILGGYLGANPQGYPMWIYPKQQTA